MTALVIGSGGQLGCAILKSCPSEVDVVGIDLPELDITDFSSCAEVVERTSPSFIINTSAYTNVDGAEGERERAFSVNSEGPRNVARIAKSCGARLIQISTDFVFDGSSAVPYEPDDATYPLSVYGCSKRDGELAVLEVHPENSVVLRTAWLYSNHGPNFVNTMLRLMGEGQSLRVVNDQQGTPTWAESLADVIWRFAAEPGGHGVYHWTDGGQATWFTFAQAIQAEALSLGIIAEPVSIEPVPTEEYPTAATRPGYSVLNCSRTIDALGVSQVDWRANLRMMLQEKMD